MGFDTIEINLVKPYSARSLAHWKILALFCSLARSLENNSLILLARSLIGKYKPYSACSLAQWRKFAFSTQKFNTQIFFDQMTF